MIDADDVQLQIKKKARRRLVGAVAFVAFAALVLPMVMDQEPVPATQEVEVHIPGQDGKPFQPNLAALPTPPVDDVGEVPPGAVPGGGAVPQPAQPAVAPPTQPEPMPLPPPPPPPPVEKPVARVLEKVPVRQEAKPEQKPETKPKAEVKPEKKPEIKPKPEQKPETKPDDAQRAAAILSGKAAEPPAAGSGGQYVILIGAFANEANVTNIKNKLGEMGVKVFTEPLESPQGKKIRVRAGPFNGRESADKALEKMKRIGVSGVVAAK